MKRRALVLADDELPPELAVGRCVEVWADDARDWISTWVNYSHARAIWEQTHPNARHHNHGAPWSWADTVGTDREAWRLDRLAAHGLTPADLPALRTAATTRLNASPLPWQERKTRAPFSDIRAR